MEGVDAAFWLGVATVGLAVVAGAAWRAHRRVAQTQRRSRTDLVVLESAVDALTRRVAMLEQQLRGPAGLPQEPPMAMDSPRTVRVDDAVEPTREAVSPARPAQASAHEVPSSARETRSLIGETAPSMLPEIHDATSTVAPITPSTTVPAAPQTDAAAVEIEGLARRIDAIRSRPIDESLHVIAEHPAAVSTLPHRDELTLIDGIDAAVEKALNDAGFRFFRDIVAAKPEELAWALAAAGPILAGTRTDHWQAQASRLAGRDDAQRQ